MTMIKLEGLTMLMGFIGAQFLVLGTFLIG